VVELVETHRSGLDRLDQRARLPGDAVIRLCLDAATSTAVLGLFRDGQELSSRRLPGARGDVLPDLLRESLAEAGLRPDQVDEVACGVGPGSFTGIRIALSTALGFGFRRNLPVRGISSLQAVLAHPDLSAASDRPRLAVLDALRGEVFLSRLGPGERAHAGLERERRASLAELPALLEEGVLVAEGRPPCLAGLPAGWKPLSDFVTAAGLDRLAALGGAVEPVPNYMRASAPEELRGA